MNELIKIIIVIITVFALNACKKSDTLNTSDFSSTKKEIIDLYNTEYLGSEISDVNWTGNTASCNAGSISTEAQTKTLLRINFYRKMAGLEGNITFDNEKNNNCQQAALMMHANGTLNHYPPDTWSCYTTAGYTGASTSNLASGSVCSKAISSYMRDSGSSNAALGHRRWILYSKAKVMGHGSTSSYDALCVLGGNASPDTLPEFIAWPPKGYVPAPIIYPRWSFSIPGADFSAATVSMTDNFGSVVSVSVIFRDAKKSDYEKHKLSSYGDNVIAWEPETLELGLDDYAYHIKVEKVKVNGETKGYEYDVIVLQIP